MFRKTLKSFGFAVNGVKVTWKEEFNFRLEVLAGIVVVFLMYYFDFDFVEKVFCILAITLVLGAEILNTAIEDLCNRVNSHTDPVIAKIKDISSAFVLVTSLGALLVGVLVFCHHFGYF